MEKELKEKVEKFEAEIAKKEKELEETKESMNLILKEKEAIEAEKASITKELEIAKNEISEKTDKLRREMIKAYSVPEELKALEEAAMKGSEERFNEFVTVLEVLKKDAKRIENKATAPETASTVKKEEAEVKVVKRPSEII